MAIPNKGEDLFVDIKKIASQPTERKHATSSSNGQPPAAGPGGSSVPDPAAAHKETFFTPTPEQTKQTEKESSAAAEANAHAASEQEEKNIAASGRTGAALTSSLIETVFGLINTGVYLTKFNSEEKEQILAIEDKIDGLQQLSPEESSLNRKFLKATEKYNNNKDKKIPLSDREMKILAEAFAEHRRITGEDLNPKLILYSAIGRVLVSRGMEIFI